jgi:hypothetical protein
MDWTDKCELINGLDWSKTGYRRVHRQGEMGWAGLTAGLFLDARRTRAATGEARQRAVLTFTAWTTRLPTAMGDCVAETSSSKRVQMKSRQAPSIPPSSFFCSLVEIFFLVTDGSKCSRVAYIRHTHLRQVNVASNEISFWMGVGPQVSHCHEASASLPQSE